MDKDDDEDIGEKLHRAHEQLDAADRKLAKIVDLIDEIVERELQEADVRTITSLRDGSVTIQLPTDRIASQLNRHVSGNYYVAITKMGDLEV